MSHHVALFAVGFLLLAVGAVLFGLGVGHLARRFGAAPWGIGFAIVPLAAATPVLALALTASLQGREIFTGGLIVGTNVVNIGLALGSAALLRPLAGSSRVVTASIAAVLGAALLYWFVCRDTSVSRLDGALLLAAFVGVVAGLFRVACDETEDVKAQFTRWEFRQQPVSLAAPAAILGIAALVGGALLTIPEAGEIGRLTVGASRQVFGPTSVALAAALALLCVTEIAARNGHADLALVAVVGATLCNLLLVPGITAITAPYLTLNLSIMKDIPAMVLLTFLLLVPALNGLQVSRWEGVVLLIAAGGFVAWRVWAR